MSRRFNEILNQPIPNADKIQICSVQEGKGMSSVKGAGSKVVPDSSSKFNRTDIEQSFFNQTANHMTMCKFSSADDQTYKNVLRVLQGYFRTIEEKRADIRRALDVNTQVKVSDFVKKLDFDGRLARERQLNTLVTDEHSFDWVWESGFVDWLKCDAKVFWIAGKPASGKSTLVNHIADHYRTRDIVKEALGGDPVIAKFFFDFRAKTDLRNNFEGLRRSLLHQLLNPSSALAADVMQHFGVDRLDDQDMLADATIFEYALNKNDRLTLLFIDGLDEYEGNKPELLSLIDKITKFKIKVCLSSRYEKPFTMTFNDLQFQFRMEILNKPGIYAYATHILQTACGIILALINSAESDLELSQLFEAALLAGNDFRSLNDNITSKDLADFKRYLETVGAGLIHCSVLEDIDYYSYCDDEHDDEHDDGHDDEKCDEHEDEHEDDDYGEEEDGDDCGDDNDDDAEAYQYQPSIHVTMMHRSVQTYLDSKGWKRLFGEQRVPASHHELWLNICHDILVGRRVRWVASAGLYSDTCSESLQPMDQKQLADCDVGLHRYAYVFLPFHAYHYEQETARSSWSLIHNVLSPRFVREHCRNNLDCRIGRRHCSDCGLSVGRSHYVTALCNDVQLVVSHRLSLYVEEALRYYPEAFQSDTFVSAIVVKTTHLGACEEESFPPKGTPEPSRHGTINAMEEWILSPMDGPRASPLATAVLWCCIFPSSERSGLILLLAPHSSRLDDLDMLVAIITLSMLEVEALLIHFSQGPLHFCSTLMNHDLSDLWFWGEERRQLATAYPCGPLWEVVKRHDSRSVAESLRYFLDRGEKIDSQCGPEGTIIHSVAEHDLKFIRETWLKEKPSREEKLDVLIDTLISYGADVNAKGPTGNVLEYFWAQAHIVLNRHYKFTFRFFKQLVEFLIKRRATNSVCDPNGLIPSKARMLAVAEADGPSEEDVSYYFHGICSDRWAKSYRRQLDGLPPISFAPKRRATY